MESRPKWPEDTGEWLKGAKRFVGPHPPPAATHISQVGWSCYTKGSAWQSDLDQYWPVSVGPPVWTGPRSLPLS